MIEVFYDMVAIRRQTGEEKVGSIIIDRGDEAAVRGTVVAVGHGHMSPDGKMVPLPYKVGDIVVYHAKHAETVRVPNDAGEEKFACVRAGNIFGRIGVAQPAF